MPSVAPVDVPKLLGTIAKPLRWKGKPDTLSVCMIVKNEEENLERAIRSFLPFADEIIVNDTGSTDQTVAIAESLPKTKVIHSEWIHDFSHSRNQSLDAATCSWILWMDADDVVPPEQVNDFCRLKTASRDRAFGFQVVNTQAGGMPIGARFVQIRMFPNHPEIRFERAIHEQIVFSLAAQRLHIFYLATEIHHMGYEDESTRIHKSERNLDLILKEPDRGIDPVISTQLGDAFSILGRWEEAIAAYQEVFSIPHAQEINVDAWREVFITIGKAFLAQKNYDQALQWFADAEKENPGRIDPVFFRAETCFQKGDYAQASQLFRQCLEMERTHSSQATHFDVMRMYSWKYLCDIYKYQKNAELLYQTAKSFHQEFPQIVESWFYLGQSYLSLGHLSDAVAALEHGVQANPTASRDAWIALQFAYEKQGDQTKVQETRKRMAEAFAEELKEDDLSQQKPLLSVVLIVKNEEKNLRDCLLSVQDIADEIVVVDTGSTDGTVHIAMDMGAQVEHFDWCDDFATARNASLQAAHGTWILWMDADDRLLAEDRRQIKQLLQKYPPHSAFSFLIKNSQDQGLTGPVFNQIRLFPNHPKIRFEGRVHEQVMPALQRLGIPVEFLSIRVIHTGYTDSKTIEAKQRRNLNLMLKDLKQDPSQVNAMKLFAVGNCYLDLKENTQAEEWYRKAMHQAESVGEDRHILESAPIKIAECRGNAGFKEEAERMMEEYLRQRPLQPNALFLKAQLSASLKKEDQAMREYGRLVHFQEEPTLMPVDYQQIKMNACQYIAQILHDRGYRELATEILRMALMIGKGESVSGTKLAALYFQFELYDLSLDTIQFARQLGDGPVLALSEAQIQIMLNDGGAALDVLSDGVKQWPEDLDLRNLLVDLQTDLARD